MQRTKCSSLFFFFNDTATPEISPLSLPDPLPIFWGPGKLGVRQHRPASAFALRPVAQGAVMCEELPTSRADLASGEKLFTHHCALCHGPKRSEEHTSELQSRLKSVCRLLLGKKNT